MIQTLYSSSWKYACFHAITETSFRITENTITNIIKVVLLCLGRPYDPSGVVSTSDTSRSVNVSWNPGFDGGLVQTFTLQGKNVTEDEYTYIEQGTIQCKCVDNQISLYVVLS